MPAAHRAALRARRDRHYVPGSKKFVPERSWALTNHVSQLVIVRGATASRSEVLPSRTTPAGSSRTGAGHSHHNLGVGRHQLLQPIAHRRQIILPAPLPAPRGKLWITPLHFLLEIHAHASHQF